MDRRSLMKPGIEVARSDIEQVVHAFNARVRAHPVLAQVFARHVDDWPAHEDVHRPQGQAPKLRQVDRI